MVNESYVNLRKKMVKKPEIKTEQIQQENKKLCREFKRKQVTHITIVQDLPCPHCFWCSKL